MRWASAKTIDKAAQMRRQSHPCHPCPQHVSAKIAPSVRQPDVSKISARTSHPQKNGNSGRGPQSNLEQCARDTRKRTTEWAQERWSSAARRGAQEENCSPPPSACSSSEGCKSSRCTLSVCRDGSSSHFRPASIVIPNIVALGHCNFTTESINKWTVP